MSRRNQRSTSQTNKPAEPAGSRAATRPPHPARKRGWLLATAIVLQAAWIGVLVVLSLKG